MEQKNVDASSIISVDYQADIPSAFRQFKPLVSQEGDNVCCLLGLDPQSGIFGCGKSSSEANLDWGNHFAQEISHPTLCNDTINHILENFHTT